MQEFVIKQMRNKFCSYFMWKKSENFPTFSKNLKFLENVGKFPLFEFFSNFRGFYFEINFLTRLFFLILTRLFFLFPP